VVSSDAGFVCWGQKQGRTLILCNGSYATIEGGPELHCRRKSWGGVTLQGSKRMVLSSDPETVQKQTVAPDQQPGSASRHS
jgi:hypothetical protein